MSATFLTRCVGLSIKSGNIAAFVAANKNTRGRREDGICAIFASSIFVNVAYHRRKRYHFFDVYILKYCNFK